MQDNNMIIQISTLWLIFYAIAVFGGLVELHSVSAARATFGETTITGAVAAWK